MNPTNSTNPIDPSDPINATLHNKKGGLPKWKEYGLQLCFTWFDIRGRLHFFKFRNSVLPGTNPIG
jgi:hypothetical protein